MAWLLLVIAGLLEVGWAVCMKLSDGFTRPLYTILTLVALAASMGLLALSLRALPVGTAYAVWVGIGAFGTAVVGITVLGEPASPGRLVFLALLLLSIVGLRLTHPTTP